MRWVGAAEKVEAKAETKPEYLLDEKLLRVFFL